VIEPTRSSGVSMGPNAVTRDRALYILALAIVGTVGTIVSMVSPLIVDALVRSTNLTLSQAGFCASLEIGATCLGNLAAVFLMRSVGPRRLIGVGLILMVIGNVLCYHIPGFHSFATYRSCAGLGSGLTNVWAGLIVQTARPQRNYAIYMAVNNLAVAILGAAVPSLVRWQGVGAVYLCIALIPLLCAAFLGLLPSRAEATRIDRGVGPANRSGQTAASAMQFFFFFGLSIVWVYLSQYGSRSHIGEASLSTVVSLGWLLVAPLGSLAASYLDRRVSARKVLFPSSLVLIGVITLLSFTDDRVLFSSASLLIIFLWSLMVPPMMEMVAQLDASGRLGTVTNLMAILGFAAGPAVGASLIQNSPIGALTAVSVLGFVAMIFTIPLAAAHSSAVPEHA
jgi:MFS transporter, DHA1 family, inner membrane transport protein